MDLAKFVNLKASKPNQSCVQVTWTKKESGACLLNQVVKYKNQGGDSIYTQHVNNVGKVQKCGMPSSVHITTVELTISFKSNSNKFQQIVLQKFRPATTGNNKKFLISKI